jgi:hypothetical protein
VPLLKLFPNDHGEANVICYRTEGTQDCDSILLPSEDLQFIPAVRQQKYLAEAIVQGVSFLFSKDESFLIFDCETTTITFYNSISFAYEYIVTVVGTVNFTLAGEN